MQQTKTDGRITIEMWFKSLDLLFDPSDTFPFPKKELTDQAEDAIFGQFIDLYLRKDNELILHVPRGSVPPKNKTLMADAMRHHFSFRLDDLAREKKSSWREGKVSVALMIVNICIGIVVFYIYYHTEDTSFWFNLIVGIFLIINWVTIWDTYEYFLYDYRKLWRKYRVYKKLTQTQVTIMETD